jgi:hypothetical protein
MHGSQLGQPHPVGEPGPGLPRYFPHQPGLSDATGPGDRHEPVLIQQPVQLPRIIGSAHETG